MAPVESYGRSCGSLGWSESVDESETPRRALEGVSFFLTEHSKSRLSFPGLIHLHQPVELPSLRRRHRQNPCPDRIQHLDAESQTREFRLIGATRPHARYARVPPLTSVLVAAAESPAGTGGGPPAGARRSGTPDSSSSPSPCGRCAPPDRRIRDTAARPARARPCAPASRPGGWGALPGRLRGRGPSNRPEDRKY